MKMSYQIKIDPRSSKAGRFISRVHKEIQNAFVSSGMKQNDLAKKLEIDRSVINRQLLGESNLTLRSISDLAWAMGCDINFTISKPNHSHGANYVTEKVKTETRIQMSPDSAQPITSTKSYEYSEAEVA